MEVEQAAVLELLPDLKNLTVLDAGCGTGRYLQLCAHRGAHVVGFDRSAAMLRYASDISPRIVSGGLCEVPLQSESVDVIVCGLALGDVQDLAAAIGELARVLRPGGTMIYSVVHPDGGHRGWSRSFEVDGRSCAVKTYWHTRDDHRQACAAAGLDIDAWHEPALDEMPGMPVALVVRARTGARMMWWSTPITFVNARVVGADGRMSRTLRVRRGRIDGIGVAPDKSDTVLDLDGALIFPGLINAHDHLELNSQPRLKWRERYENAREWIADFQPRFDSDPQLAVTRPDTLADRVWVGGLKNLLSGVTTVCHHNPLAPAAAPALPDPRGPSLWLQPLACTSMGRRWRTLIRRHRRIGRG